MPGSATRNIDTRTRLTVNGRTYKWPVDPVVVICLDGCGPAYLRAASEAGLTPALDQMRRDGFWSTALAVMPTFTNPNNISIVCGAPPSVHGVSGNFYWDATAAREVMMLDASPLRADTILGAFSKAGADVLVITAKDKLRQALSKGMSGIAFSAEKADQCAIPEVGDLSKFLGVPYPSQYSSELSYFVMEAGVRLFEKFRPEISYLTLSDFVQHKYAPGTPQANEFLRQIDLRIAVLLDLGAVVGVVADHGMSDMSKADGTPEVVYVADYLYEYFPAEDVRVICPITDPFVRHHGALGGFVRVHLLSDRIDKRTVKARLDCLPGIDLVLTRAEACSRFDLPPDREADFVLVAKQGVALGARAADHDLSQLDGHRLRSHGGLCEQEVPFIISRPVTTHNLVRHHPQRGVRSYDIFDFALNVVQ